MLSLNSVSLQYTVDGRTEGRTLNSTFGAGLLVPWHILQYAYALCVCVLHGKISCLSMPWLHVWLLFVLLFRILF